MDESAVSESERPAVEQSNEFESSAERLESPTKQGTTEQRSLEPEKFRLNLILIRTSN